MRGTLGSLALLTLALNGGAIAVRTLWRCNSSDPGILGCALASGFVLVALGGSASLFALILGITACRAAWQRQRWIWFAVFLSLAMLVVAAPTLILVISNTPLYESLADDIFLLLRATLLLTSALALLTLIYLRTTALTGPGRTAPVPSGE